MQIPEQFCARIHPSANRPHLLLGCEPTAIAIVFIGCVIVGFSMPTIKGVATAIGLFFLLRYGLRTMAQADPILIKVWDNSQRYSECYWTAKGRG